MEWLTTFEKIALTPAEGKTFAARTVRPGFSGLVNANRSERSIDGSPIDRGPSTWSDIFFSYHHDCPAQCSGSFGCSPHLAWPVGAFGGPPNGVTWPAASGMDFRYSTSAQRSSSVSSGPMTPFPKGAFSKEWPLFELPISDVSIMYVPDLHEVSTPTFTGSKSRPRQNFFVRSAAGTSISYRLGTDPLCMNGGVAQTPSRGAAL